jgi:hypothetical protein
VSGPPLRIEVLVDRPVAEFALSTRLQISRTALAAVRTVIAAQTAASAVRLIGRYAQKRETQALDSPLASCELKGQSVFAFFCERAGRVVGRTDVLSATAARISALSAFSLILSPS